MTLLPRALPTVLTAALLVPLTLAVADGAAVLPDGLCAETAVDRHLGTGPTCLQTRLDPASARLLVDLWSR